MQVVKQRPDGTPVERQVTVPVLLHDDIIADKFWDVHLELLQ